MLISQILLDQFRQGLLHLKGNLVGHISQFKKPLEVKIFILEFYCNFCFQDDRELSRNLVHSFFKIH
jgi:hypothetical protein